MSMCRAMRDRTTPSECSSRLAYANRNDFVKLIIVDWVCNFATSISADVPNARTGKQAVASSNFFVTPGYFTTLLAGRDLDHRDTKNAPPVAVVNGSVARRFFPGVNAMGRSFRLRAGQPALVEIVGIVKDSKYGSLRR